MATFHQNLVQSFTNFKNKYLRQYDTYEDAVEDIDNIPEGGIFYTNDNSSVQDIIDGMTALHLAGSQAGSGTKNFTFNTEAQKRMLCITKKSGVIVESKEIPTDVLETGDVIVLGATLSVVGTNKIHPGATSLDNNLVGKELEIYNYYASGSGISYNQLKTTGNTGLGNSKTIGLGADQSLASGASITYNGNDSFTISVTDSTLSVYVYIDMLVLGGSASGRNVSFDAAGTSLESTDVEGAIKEINAGLSDIVVESTTAKIVGKDADGNNIYEKVYKGTSLSNNQVIDNTLTLTNVSHFEYVGSYTTNTEMQLIPHDATTSNTRYCVVLKVTSTGLIVTINATTGITNYYIKVRYVLAS